MGQITVSQINPEPCGFMKILCLTDFPVKPPDRWLWSYLPDQVDEVDFLWAASDDRFGGWKKFLARYPFYYRLASRALSQVSRAPYDLVVAWESGVGVPFALFKRLAGKRLPPFLLLAFNPGDVPSVWSPLIKAGLENVDHLTVLTHVEADDYERRYHIPAQKISVCPLPAYDIRQEVLQLLSSSGVCPQPFIHASGISSRDYGTLIKAVEGLAVEVIIHGRGYNFKGLTIPPNVEIGDLATREEFHRLVASASFEVVPLQRQLRPAGSSQVVFSMMMGKPVIVTGNASMRDLVVHGQTGLLVEPQNVESMRQAIVLLLENPELVVSMGQAARQRYEQLHSFASFARRAHELIVKVVEEHGCPQTQPASVK